MFNPKQVYQGRHDLFHGKPSQSVFVAHDEHLAHLYDGLQLLALVACRLKALEQLLGLRCSCDAKKVFFFKKKRTFISFF